MVKEETHLDVAETRLDVVEPLLQLGALGAQALDLGPELRRLLARPFQSVFQSLEPGTETHRVTVSPSTSKRPLSGFFYFYFFNSMAQFKEDAPGHVPDPRA